MENKRYDNLQAQRRCAHKRYLSNVAIISLANLYGAEITIRKSTTTDLDKIVMGNNLTVDSFILPNQSDPVEDNQNVPEQEIENETDKTDKTKSKTKPKKKKKSRNTKIIEQKMKINALFDYIKECNPQIQLREGKPRPVEKTVKQMRVKWIDPFNEVGTQKFAELVSNDIISREATVVTKKRSVIHLEREDPKITEAYWTVFWDESHLSMNGKILYYQLIVLQQMIQIQKNPMNILELAHIQMNPMTIIMGTDDMKTTTQENVQTEEMKSEIPVKEEEQEIEQEMECCEDGFHHDE